MRERQEQERAPDFEYHPDNEDAIRVFLSLGTQWRVIAGMGGAIPQGLDYPSVLAVIPLLGIARAQRTQLFHDLRTMEAAALRQFARQRKVEADRG